MQKESVNMHAQGKEGSTANALTSSLVRVERSNWMRWTREDEGFIRAKNSIGHLNSSGPH